ncbi:Kunitz/Bovine pancreatic trypsin inhibitor domain protein [Oesophagostomum dentatum]|uniref:Kunitz/Bovine pancreatic trypsin inhibitor domain protein n=1 Tax=Oesophagostomum dentatum TaxID=61180 RepID=A0A0B1SSR7_OESDE|nr:Kunitz/Bovine pancreatic trypsin inhibitor domain protein [Oesophagostomum dentatum]
MTHQCLPFRYKGCGGNKNNYKSLDECKSVCAFRISYDSPSCSGKEPSTGSCNSEGLGCPEGSICFLPPFGTAMGICCDEEIEEQYRKEWHPECDDGKVLITRRVGDKRRREPFLGKKCSHEFCPEGADCVEGKMLSHCCGPEEIFGPEKV